MKATGIVRRLDDLGRLVIPKEIRKIYKLKEGDSIEFYVSDNNEIMIRKYEHLSDHNQDLLTMLETFYELFKSDIDVSKVVDKEIPKALIKHRY